MRSVFLAYLGIRLFATGDRLAQKWSFSLLFVYFGVHSTAMHSKISLNQKKNPLFLISGAPVATSLLFLNVEMPNVRFTRTKTVNRL
jgi:hypothetical protein